ncbi:Fc.00g079140.m01.CDS01 [Cosmosporella sp. VM-42]
MLTRKAPSAYSSDQSDWNVTVPERTLSIYPSTPTAAAQGPSEYTNVSGVTPRVSDYGRGVRQRNEQGEPHHPEPRNDILRGIDTKFSAESSQRPEVIGNEDLGNDQVGAPIKKLLNDALESDQRCAEKRFLPCRKLEGICNFESVHSELQQCLEEAQALNCAKYVCGDKEPAREIFAILVLINQVNFIAKFMEAEIHDDDLPFGGSMGQTKLWTRHSTENSPIDFFDHSEDAETMREFYNKQWWVHVPFLARDKNNNKAISYEFEPGTVMPWTFVGEKIENGGYGRVEEIGIHQDHHSFSQYKSFALKTLHPDYKDNSKAFKQEISAFRKMAPGPHLVELCATFRIGSSFMLIFPWAAGGSLETLWEKPRESICGPETTELVRWIASECQGLIEGLQMIHDTRIAPQIGGDEDEDEREKYYGIHGDIKPANILHFSQETSHHRLGTLKVADFGLMKFHHRRSRTKKSPGTAYAASQTYRSPEHDIGQTMSKKVDIWALGCVFSELLTWVLRHPGARKEYVDQRMKEPSYSGAHDKGQWSEDTFFVKRVAKGRGLVDSSPSSAPAAQDAGPSKNGSMGVKRIVKRKMSHVMDKLESILPGPTELSTVETPELKVSVSKVGHQNSKTCPGATSL